VAWQDQGRQEHGWFGHGTAAQGDVDDATNDSLFGAGGLEARIQAVAYGAVAALPSALREAAAMQFKATSLPRLTEVMRAWIRGAKLNQSRFAKLFFGRAVDDPVVGNLRAAAQGADMAKGHGELREAAGHLAAAVQQVGVGRWSRFLADAQTRANDPAAVAAVDVSREPPAIAGDAIRPVYPVETALGVGAAALAGGAAAGVRAASGAILRQLVPKRPAAAVSEDSLNFGAHKSPSKWQKQIEQRGWTSGQIKEALTNGKRYAAANNVHPRNTATRYVHPRTGQSVVVDDQTGEILHVGGPGFRY
jgi:hypothetical protein